MSKKKDHGESAEVQSYIGPNSTVAVQINVRGHNSGEMEPYAHCYLAPTQARLYAQILNQLADQADALASATTIEVGPLVKGNGNGKA